MIECAQCQYKYTNQNATQFETDIDILDVLERLQETNALVQLTPQQQLLSPFRTPTRASIMMQSNPAVIV